MTSGTAVDCSPQARPRLRPDVVLGPALLKGAGLTHNVKDTRTGRFFQIGVREHFIISRLDGRSTLEEIGDRYAETFRRRVGAPQWRQILDMLATRQLLDGTADEAALDRLGRATRQHPRGRQSLLRYRLPLVDPDRFLGRLEPRVSFLFSPYLVVPCLVAVLALDVAVALGAGRLFADARELWRHPVPLLAAAVLIWLSLALHEAAHGLACKHFGGAAPEIGLLWRFPLFAPYCDSNDVVLFGRRRERVYTAFAGIFASAVFPLPFAPLWAVSPAGGQLRMLSAGVLLFGSAGALLNAIPFAQFDGYFVVNHALGMQNLRTESQRYLVARLAAARAGRRSGRTPGAEPVPAAAGYPRRAALVYTLYAVCSIMFTVGLTGTLAVSWLLVLVHFYGAPVAFAVVLGAGGAVLVVWRGVRALRRRTPGRVAAR